MNELSLFSGADGGLLGTLLLGWRCLGYVEWETYCQRVLEQRIVDGILDHAPIFGDVREFVQSGAAREYRGAIDVVTAGFPCQPFSWAGSKRGADDERNMWPATIAVLREVRPRFAFLENVPGLLAHPYFGTVLGDLAEAGFDARWGVLGADDVGAPHLRKRLWIRATSRDVPDTERDELRQLGERGREQRGLEGQALARDDGEERPVADPDRAGREQQRRTEPDGEEHSPAQRSREEMADTHRRRLRVSRFPQYRDIERQLWTVPDRRGEGGRWLGSHWNLDPADEAESGVGRVVDGVAHRVDRIRALGNGQVPLVAACAWLALGR